MKQTLWILFAAAVLGVAFGCAAWHDQNPSPPQQYGTVSVVPPAGYNADVMDAVMNAGSDPIRLLHALGRPGFTVQYVNPSNGHRMVWSHGVIRRERNLTLEQAHEALYGGVGTEQVGVPNGAIVSVLPDDGVSGRIFVHDKASVSAGTAQARIDSQHVGDDMLFGAIVFAVAAFAARFLAPQWDWITRKIDGDEEDWKRNRFAVMLGGLVVAIGIDGVFATFLPSWHATRAVAATVAPGLSGLLVVRRVSVEKLSLAD